VERRVFLTLIFCTLFTIVYLKLTPKPPEAPGLDHRPPATGSSSETGAPNRAGEGASPASPSGNDVGGDEAGVHEATEVAETLIEPFDSEHLRIEFTSQGAAVRQVYLKQFRNTADPVQTEGEVDWVSIFPAPEDSFGDALTLRELSSPGVPARYGLEQKHWKVSRNEPVGADGTRTIEFQFETHDGLEFVKRFVCSPREHYVQVSVGVRDLEPERSGRRPSLVLLLRAAGGIADVERGQWTLDPQGVAMVSEPRGEPVVRKFNASDLDDGPELVQGQGQNTVAWGGCANLYFTALLAPDVPGSVSAVELRSTDEERIEKIQSELILPMLIPRDGTLSEASFRYFVGPKSPELLEAQGLAVLQPLIEEDYGSWSSFRWINKLLLFVLSFFHGLIGNWGVAIILLTLLVRMCIFPVTRTQQVSMQRYSMKMQKLKPKLDALKAKYKDKPQRFAQEQMKLLKEHNARPPLLGCLSTLITFPVFIGMFQILRTSIDLRQAPFAGWIHDLSLPDAMFEIPGAGFDFNLLPILATAAFVGQMALAPKPADPQARQQQKIMYIMPVVFGVMFYNYAAGLSLYMLTSSLYGIVESKIIRKRFMPAE